MTTDDQDVLEAVQTAVAKTKEARLAVAEAMRAVGNAAADRIIHEVREETTS